MDSSDLDYELPADAIAQVPTEPRDAARLLDATGGRLTDPVDRHVYDLPGLVGPGDVIVVNDTRVLPARLRLRKATGARVEVLLLAPLADRPHEWEALVGSAHRVAEGTALDAIGMVVRRGRGSRRRPARGPPRPPRTDR